MISNRAKSALSVQNLVLLFMASLQICFFAFHHEPECDTPRIKASHPVVRLRKATQAETTNPTPDKTDRMQVDEVIGSVTKAPYENDEMQAEETKDRITHAPYGECTEEHAYLSPHGATHPQVRWHWDQLTSPKLIVEVGGNSGEDLQALLRLYPDSHFHSFEPVHKHYDTLRNKFAEQTKSGQVTLYNVGVSDSDAKVTFRTDGDQAASSQYGTVNRDGQEAQFEEVTLRDIHSLLDEIVQKEGRQIDVLSMNCEGCEYAVLERLRDKGWLGRLGVLQVSWHASSSIPRRLARRCALAKDIPGKHFRISAIADFSWVIYHSMPRPYAVEDKFLGNLSPADIGHSNGLPQAQAGIDCSNSLPSGARGVVAERDPAASHRTYPQTMDMDRALEVLEGRALVLPSHESQLIVKVGSSAALGNAWRGVLAVNPRPIVHSFEAVASMRKKMDAHPADRFGDASEKQIWDFGLASENRTATFRVWGLPVRELKGEQNEIPASPWDGRLEEVELKDAEHALATVEHMEGRVPDLVYLNCEGCEYEVLTRLADSGRLKRLPRLAIFWHAGGAPWQTRCITERLLRRTHRQVRAVHSAELWASLDVPEGDLFGASPAPSLSSQPPTI